MEDNTIVMAPVLHDATADVVPSPLTPEQALVDSLIEILDDTAERLRQWRLWYSQYLTAFRSYEGQR